MKRRTFLKSSLAAGVGAALPATRLWAAGKKQEYYELRAYRIPDAASRDLVLDVLEAGLVPALGRAGLGPTGVFTVAEAPDDLSVFVIIPFPTLEAFDTLRSRLEGDDAYLKAASAIYARPKEEPVYTRIESWFMRAFSGMPVMELPSQTRAKEPRMFEVRVYESPNEEMGRRKIDMFNSGEIDVMREVGLAPLLYGETLIGDNVPNLTYILSAANAEVHKEHWQAFGKHPEWNRMKAMEKYKDTISKIENYFLVPTDFSQI